MFYSDDFANFLKYKIFISKIPFSHYCDVYEHVSTSLIMALPITHSEILTFLYRLDSLGYTEVPTVQPWEPLRHACWYSLKTNFVMLVRISLLGWDFLSTKLLCS